jgi:ubiquinone/menaquinone biosynthesis C-methylase UbiE
MVNTSGEQAYCDELWRHKGSRLEEDPKFKEKIEIIKEMIPSSVATILDVGCGDGSLTNHLVSSYAATAVDTSPIGLSFLAATITAVQSSAADLPFPDAAFDLVLSSELLEHLDSPTFQRALEEIVRVSRRYILISMPNNENLRRRITHYFSCGHEPE